MNIETLVEGVNYFFGGISGSIYLDEGEKTFTKRPLEHSCGEYDSKHDHSSLEKLVGTQKDRK